MLAQVNQTRKSLGSTLVDAVPKRNSTNVNNDKQPQQSVLEAVGNLSTEYPCFYNSCRGTLFAGSDGILFQGHKFFVQTHRVGVEWKDVLRVEKSEYSVLIVSVSDDEASYEFTSIQRVDRVWSTLMSLHHESMTGRAPPMNSPKPVLRRTVTDPLPDVHAEGPQSDGGSPPAKKGFSAAHALAAMSEFRSMSDFRSMSLPTPVHLTESSKSELTSTDEEEANGSSLNQQWTQMRTESSQSFSVCVIKDRELPCCMEVFFEIFLSDTAKHSIPSYMEEQGDSDFVVSPWKLSDDGVSKTRTIEYTHPVNAPMAPPTARARKEQRFQRYGDHGQCIETQTFVKDVPMTDCFYVVDRILVEPNTQGVLLTTEFDIRFVKSTMFRAIISSTTQREFKKFLGGMVDLMCKSVGGDTGIVAAPRQPIIETETVSAEVTLKSPSKESPLAYLILALLLLVLLFQMWIMYQIKDLQAVTLSLQSELHKTCSDTPAVRDI